MPERRPIGAHVRAHTSRGALTGYVVDHVGPDALELETTCLECGGAESNQCRICNGAGLELVKVPRIACIVVAPPDGTDAPDLRPWLPCSCAVTARNPRHSRENCRSPF